MSLFQEIVLAIAVAWPTITGIATAVIGWKSDEEWASMVRDTPRKATFIKLLRKVGLDSPGTWRLLRELLSRPARPLPPPPPAPVTPTLRPVETPAPPPAANSPMRWYPFFGWAFMASLVGILACGPQFWTDVKTVERTIVDCVLGHPGVPETKLRTICKYAEEQIPTVLALIAEQRDGMARAGMSPDGGVCRGAP